MEITAAQLDMSASQVGGAPGVFISGSIWLLAGIVGMNRNAKTAFLVLFLGGMLIVPASLVIARGVFKAPRPSPSNPLERLGLEGTFVLFAGILIGYALLSVAPDLALPALAVAIGARYFAFRTIYAEPVYWALGATLATIGTLAMLRILPLPIAPALLVGAVECGFAGLLLLRWKRRSA